MSLWNVEKVDFLLYQNPLQKSECGKQNTVKYFALLFYTPLFLRMFYKNKMIRQTRKDARENETSNFIRFHQNTF